jgi:hypothetical protein
MEVTGSRSVPLDHLDHLGQRRASGRAADDVPESSSTL